VVTVSAVRQGLIRPLRASIVIAVLAASALGIGAGPAQAAGNGIFLACPDYNSAATATGSGCTSLSTTLTDALAFANEFASSVTVKLMPGGYCPFTLTQDSRAFNLVGVGAAGLTTPDTFTGSEAGLTSIAWDSSCGATPPGYGLTTPEHGNQLLGTIRLENLAVVGAASGPSNGIDIVNADVFLRDVLVQGFTSGTGYTYTNTGAFQSQNMQVDDSAFLGNATGVNFSSEGSIDESTIAGNTTDGITAAGNLNLDNDAIAHNHNGVDMISGSTVPADNSIGANNTTDCAGATSDWENGGFSETNLTGSTCPKVASDIDGSAVAIASTALNGGPTPTILPPTEAHNTADPSICGSTGTDQREYLESGAATCDIGAVNSNLTRTPDPEPSPTSIDFGTVPTNNPSRMSTTIFNEGDDVIGIAGVEITPASGFSIASGDDGCSFSALLHQVSTSCFITVTAAPTVVGGAINGDLIVHTTGGDVDVPLTATGGTPLTPPSDPQNVTATAGNGKVTVTWAAPADDGGQNIDGYDVRYSSNGGSSWTVAPRVYDTVDVIKNLTNGQAYIFEVRANNDYAVGPYSDPTAAVTPHGPTTASSLSASANVTIGFGSSKSLSTRLTDGTTGNPLPSMDVALTAKSNGPGYKTVGTATTNANGVAHLTVSPPNTTFYKWTFAGLGSHRAATSAVSTVSVSQIVKAKLTKSKVKHRKHTMVWGTVSPHGNGQTVTLQEKQGGKWTDLPITQKTRVQKLPNGKTKAGFVLTFTPKQKGRVTLRVASAGTRQNSDGFSHPLTLKVT
jgi:5-hydroxyisourate hydrolase-like protein (transthyretin family)